MSGKNEVENLVWNKKEFVVKNAKLMNAKSKIIDNLKTKILENAAHLKLSELKISDRVKLDASMQPIDSVKALYSSSENIVSDKCKYYKRMPYKPLPNAVMYGIVLSAYDWIAAIFGISERMYKHGRLVLNWRNNDANKFIKYRFNHLGFLRDEGNSKEYWRQATSLLKSEVFQAMALNHVCGSWHTDMTTDQVGEILSKVKQIVKERQTDIELRRVYIPKPNTDKVRPLGVPSQSWRIYLHMWYCLIVWYRMGTDKNHAYIPGKGIHTAWAELISRIFKEENVYEFDLRSFFPSVNLSEIEKLLTSELKVPRHIAEYLTKLNQSITILTKEDKLNEDNDRKVLLTPSNMPNPNLDKEVKSKIENIVSSKQKLTGDERVNLKFSEEELKSILPNSEWKVYRTHGVPQGAGTSCSLSTISLAYLWKSFKKRLTMYADDGLAFPKFLKDIVKLTDKERGVEPNNEKSEWIKIAGKFVKNTIKFLGFILEIGKTLEESKIYSSTRNGAKLEFKDSINLLVYLEREWNSIRKNYIKYGNYEKSVEYKYNSQSKRTTLVHKNLSQKSNQKVDESQTIKEWLMQTIEKYIQLSRLDQLRLLFTPEGLDKMSQMQNGSWGKLSYESNNKYAWGSWYHQNGPAFLYQSIISDWYEFLTIEYWKRAKRLKIIFNCERPNDIWNWKDFENITKDFTEDQLEKAIRLDETMTNMKKVIKTYCDKAEFVETINSLFKWNIPVNKEKVIPELKKIIAILLREHPVSLEGMRTLATADLLENGLSKNTKIRSCICLKRSLKLVKSIKPSESKNIGKPLDLKKFKKEMGWSNEIQTLI